MQYKYIYESLRHVQDIISPLNHFLCRRQDSRNGGCLVLAPPTSPPGKADQCMLNVETFGRKRPAFDENGVEVSLEISTLAGIVDSETVNLRVQRDDGIVSKEHFRRLRGRTRDECRIVNWEHEIVVMGC